MKAFNLLGGLNGRRYRVGAWQLYDPSFLKLGLKKGPKSRSQDCFNFDNLFSQTSGIIYGMAEIFTLIFIFTG